MNHSNLRRRRRPIMQQMTLASALVLAAMLAVLGFAHNAHAQAPTVNGLFHGDGDNARYVEYATSADGSKLYTYYDASTNELYGAVVISHSINDLVCSPKADLAYIGSAGWSVGNAGRTCKRASDSEFAEFTLTCGSTSYTWGQALGCAEDAGPPLGTWKSDASCGSSTGTWPTGLVASTSWVANINTYQAHTGIVPWNLYDGGTDIKDWKSPFTAADPYDVTSVAGYPTFTTYNQLLASEPVDKGWEWSVVYEWSLDVSGCADNAISFNPSNSHHSPPKRSGPNDEEWPDPQTEPLSDWGDLPEGPGLSYPTTLLNDGARHRITASGPYLGANVDIEADGMPQSDALGDDNSGAEDEDGIVFLTPLIPGTADIQVTITVSDSTAYFSAFIDFDGDGVLEPVTLAAGGTVGDLPLGNGVHTLTINVPVDATSGTMAARFRVTDEAGEMGNSISGAASNGEVEDYIMNDPGSLPVSLSYFLATRNADGWVDFVWETATETGNAGFNLYVEVDGSQTLINEEFIPSTVIDSVEIVHYSYQADVAGEVFYLEQIDISGQRDRKGPFALGVEYGVPSDLPTIPDGGGALQFIYLPFTAN